MDYKKQKEIPTGEAATKNKRNMRDRQKIIEKTQQMNASVTPDLLQSNIYADIYIAA